MDSVLQRPAQGGKPRVVVVGGGIAGLSLSAALGESATVTLLEREGHLGYHASGRSAALFSETYGNELVRALSVASRPAFVEGGFFDHKRGALHVRGPSDGEAIDALAEAQHRLVPSVRRLSRIEINTLVPVIDASATCGGVLEPNAMDIDTGKMIQSAAAAMKASGGRIVTGAEVLEISANGSGFRVATGAGTFVGDIVVNASGAWADDVASRAGLSPLGLSPKRRTAFLFDAPAGIDTRHWPLVVDLHERFYFKPDAGRLIGSLADETDSLPCDAYPEDLDVAIAVDRIEQATALRIDRPSTPWAGLRTFSPDRSPVVGFDRRSPGFFWLAGQGGYGFQVSLALSRLSAALLHGKPLPQDMADLGVAEHLLSPDRFLKPSLSQP